MTSDIHLRVLLVEPRGALGAGLAIALARLGCRVTWFGRGQDATPTVPGLLPIVGDRRRLLDLRSIGGGSFDALVDFGCSEPDSPLALHQVFRGRVGLFIYLSTWRVYAGAGDSTGMAPPLPVGEDAPLRGGPRAKAEECLWGVRSAETYPVTVLRLASLYGPGVRFAREWHVVDRLRRGRRRIAIPWDGSQLLHRLYVDNAVHAIISVLDHPREVDGRVFNVGDSDVPTALRLVESIAQVSGCVITPVRLPTEWFDPCNPWAPPHPVVLDLHRLRARLGYQEPVAPAEGLARTVRWLWDLPEETVASVLAPYWQCFGAHDLAGEDAALERWDRRDGEGDARRPQ